jgi:hypothetical protein
MSHRSRRAYDHRIKEQIIRAGEPELFPELEIPRSTAVSWIRRGVGEIVSLVQADGGEPTLAVALARASAAQEWAVVARLARELEARRLSPAGVRSLLDERGRCPGQK